MGLLNAVFDGALLSPEGEANGTKVLPTTEALAGPIAFVELDEGGDGMGATDGIADQDTVTAATESLGLLLDDIMSRLRTVEHLVTDLAKQMADR